MTGWTDYVKTNRKAGETYKAALSRCAPGYQKSKPKTAVKKDVVKPKATKAVKDGKPAPFMEQPPKVKKTRKPKVAKAPVVEAKTSEY
tara:strand:+ start:369 stop:632 length:264 start_codon:yes stop_codon:yes gene_type:complete